jgi:hypothetical protein
MLLWSFRKLLVDDWPERMSIGGIFSDARLDAGKYIVDAPRVDGLWTLVIKRIGRDNRPIKPIIVVMDSLDTAFRAVQHEEFQKRAVSNPTALGWRQGFP